MSSIPLKYQWRYFLKDSIRREVDFSSTPQNLGFPPPPLEKPYPSDATLVRLVPPDRLAGIGTMPLREALAARKSHRAFSRASLSLEEMSFLLWATQGLRKPPTATGAYRTVPSAGCRHALETSLAVFNVAELARGLYRYLPVEHALVAVAFPDHLEARVGLAAMGQAFVAGGAAAFFWTAVPARMEWRYAEASAKVIAIEAGHVCQNLYLACAAVGAGTCAVAAYDQEEADALLGVDGEEEFTIYLAPVGKV